MKLKRLEIELKQWGPNEGRYEATIEYEGQTGAVKLALDPDLSNDLLRAAAGSIAKFSAIAADRLRADAEQSIAEAKALPASTAAAIEG